MEKNGAGQVLSAAMSRREGDSAGELRSSGVITKQGIFLVAESVDDSGKPDGRLECRDGPGVHLIPSRSDNRVELLSPRLFYPTGDAHALLLAATPDESELLLYACEDGKLVLTSAFMAGTAADWDTIPPPACIDTSERPSPWCLAEITQWIFCRGDEV